MKSLYRYIDIANQFPNQGNLTPDRTEQVDLAKTWAKRRPQIHPPAETPKPNPPVLPGPSTGFGSFGS